MLSLLLSCLSLVLTTDGKHFSVDGKPTFLLGVSYYGGLGAPEEFIDKDLNELSEKGFNWIRLWATWNAFDNDVSALDSQGNKREPFFSKLRYICQKADQLGIVVDITLTRGYGLIQSQESHIRAVKLLVQELKDFRNLYFDLANERNIKDARYVTFEELKELRDTIKDIDPERLVTASHGGDISEDELKQYVEKVKVDFISPHRPRDHNSPDDTLEVTPKYISMMSDNIVPVHYQEPFRRGYGPWEPEACDFLRDLENAIIGGAAGWCLHNGDTRSSIDKRPRRSFDMRPQEGRLFDQLDSQEKEVIEKAPIIVKNVWEKRW